MEYTDEYVKKLEEEVKELRDSLRILFPHLNKDSMKEEITRNIRELRRNTNDSNRR